MSWYVQQLILHRMEIKEGVFSPYYDNIAQEGSNILEVPVANNLESDLYNDVLVVELAIKELFSRKRLTKKDILYLEKFSWNPYIVSLEEELKTPRAAISIRFVDICDTIANYLGGVFTDEGYLGFMKEKYSLSEDQIIRLAKYMKSNFKNKIIRTRKNKNND